MQSHKDEVHALAVHPTETQFISASLDHCVSLWDAETHQVIWTVEVEVCHQNCYTVMEWINLLELLIVLTDIIPKLKFYRLIARVIIV